ncbi:MAG TPA: beta-N-acetylhexosaminidase [Phycisphaeraceae bacterium]
MSTCQNASSVVGVLSPSGELDVIPSPRRVDFGGTPLVLTPEVGCALHDLTGSERLAPAVSDLAESLQRIARIVDASASDGQNRPQITIRLQPDPNAKPDDESYQLQVSSHGATIVAPREAGCFYGIQTLRQMLRLASPEASHAAVTLPGVTIHDAPRYAWRGMMVDSARNYQPLSFLKQLIDKLSHYKFNVMHWHLVDDQAWRLEVKSHPRLTAEASRVSMGDESRGGCYTQQEIRELVRYAWHRFIRIVPEIEMPGHCMSALTVYPHLSCTGGPFTLPGVQCICPDIYCAGNDEVFAFIEDVLNEVIDLFPDPFIHIGGDEAPKDRWAACPRCRQRMRQEGLADEGQLQAWFIARMHRYLKSRGRRIIAWDDLGDKDLPSDVVFQWWRNRTPDAWRWPSRWASRGHATIFSPTSHCYLDYSEDLISLPQALTLSLAADHDLISPERADALFLGGECNVWTEKIPWERFLSRAFPRAYAIIEALWRADDRPNAERFIQRVSRH